ncbi:MAG: hypothetical protein KDA52_17860 [Planctomycetaceae bacterium]|nr:hypothetical protein [Planctomycetaceae bacterium]
MSVPPGHSACSQLRTDGTPAVNPVRGTLISLGFWCCLLGAIAAYGLVVLSPKFVRWSQKQHEVVDNQQQLLALQEEVTFWTELTDELEKNLDFRNSLMTSMMSSASTSRRVIPVDAAQRYSPQMSAAESEIPSQQQSPLLRVCEQVAGSPMLQTLILAGSAGVLLFSFSSLLESRPPRRRRRFRRVRPYFVRRLSGLGSRYVSGNSDRKTRSRGLMTDV